MYAAATSPMTTRRDRRALGLAGFRTLALRRDLRSRRGSDARNRRRPTYRNASAARLVWPSPISFAAPRVGYVLEGRPTEGQYVPPCRAFGPAGRFSGLDSVASVRSSSTDRDAAIPPNVNRLRC